MLFLFQTFFTVFVAKSTKPPLCNKEIPNRISLKVVVSGIKCILTVFSITCRCLILNQNERQNDPKKNNFFPGKTIRNALEIQDKLVHIYLWNHVTSLTWFLFIKMDFWHYDNIDMTYIHFVTWGLQSYRLYCVMLWCCCKS